MPPVFAPGKRRKNGARGFSVYLPDQECDFFRIFILLLLMVRVLQGFFGK
jgi:hypothetical protein